MPLLRDGDVLSLQRSSTQCRILRFLGAGAQGEVYQVELAGTPRALKCYNPEQATPQQRQQIQNLIDKGSPASSWFLWPEALVPIEDRQTFGYIMPLREERFKPLSQHLRREVPYRFSLALAVGVNLANAFFQLHARGLCYRDISLNNVFFDPSTGDVCICDNDNACPAGSPHSGVLGTPRFIAPELVLQPTKPPTTETDLYSLAVLLFYILMIHHPLDGRKEQAIHCLDLPAMKKLYGEEPVFIFDPQDDSNRPVPGRQDNPLRFWPLYPKNVRDLFLKAFTGGLRDPQERPRETVWRRELVMARDWAVYCQRCGRDLIADLSTDAPRAPTCWHCQKPVQLPVFLEVKVANDTRRVALNHDTALREWHVDPHWEWDKPMHAAAEIGKVVRHPTTGAWGLKNTWQEHWTRVAGGDTTQAVQPHQTVALKTGLQLHIGAATATVVTVS